MGWFLFAMMRPQAVMGRWSMRLLLLIGSLLGPILDSEALDFPGTISCHDDEMQVVFSKIVGNNHSWQVQLLDTSGKEMKDCDYRVDHEKQTLTAAYVNCTNLERNKHHLRFRLQLSSAMLWDHPKGITYSVGCDAVQADEASLPSGFASATNCTKDSMAVVLSSLIPTFDSEYEAAVSRAEWVVQIREGMRTHMLSLRQAMQQGYTFLHDGTNIILKVSFHATGVTAYKQDNRVLYTVALKLIYGPSERRLTVESRMICAPEPASCNATHMTIDIPAFPGSLAAVNLDDKNIRFNQLQAQGIGVDTRRGVKLYINKRDLKSRLFQDGECSGVQAYISSLKLGFSFSGEMVTMLTAPECPCEHDVPIAATCTQDGYMDFEILGSSTKPALNLNTLKLRDPACRPIFQSPSNDRVQFHVPLNGCGTKQKFNGEKMVYENEVSALWADLPPRVISRDSEFRLTVICSYGRDDASLNVQISSLPPPASVINQGPLSLILLIYPDESYLQPYSDDQYPVVKYLRQPIFLEVQVLNRDDPNLQLVLDDCWATLSLDPASLPQWHVVVDGCDYDLDNYKTVFHPVSPAVSYANFRQRFEVKAFAFVSDGKALTSLVYFHCSALICDKLNPDSPLCSTRCPPPRSRRDVTHRKNSAVVTLPHPVLLVPEEEQLVAQAQHTPEEGAWITITLMVAIILGFVAVSVTALALFNIRKKVCL